MNFAVNEIPATVKEGCKITKKAKEHIEILSQLDFNLTVMPRKDYHMFGCNMEASYNYCGDGVSWQSDDELYRFLVPDNLDQEQMIAIINCRLNPEERED